LLLLKKNKQIKTEDIKISNNEEHTCLKLNNDIVVYSNKLGFPIATLSLINGMVLF